MHAQHVVVLLDPGQDRAKHGFLQPALLALQYTQEPVSQGEVPLVARRVQGVRRLGEVLADDARVAHALVAHGQFVVGQANQPRIVRQLREFERTGVQGDGPRLLAALEGEPPLQSPQRREPCVGQRFLGHIGRTPECG
jgi:hypothetical protein